MRTADAHTDPANPRAASWSKAALPAAWDRKTSLSGSTPGAKPGNNCANASCPARTDDLDTTADPAAHGATCRQSRRNRA